MKKMLIAAAMFWACSGSRPTSSTYAAPEFDKEGHRGCRGLMPENTIPAMLKAIDLGVTTLELDVVISQDKKVVVSHDAYFNETITTLPTGGFIPKGDGPRYLLYAMSYDSIKKFDVGLKPHPDFPRQKKMAAYKPLLSELFTACEEYAKEKGRTLWYNVEIKSNAASDGKRHPPVEEFAQLVMSVIHSGPAAARTIIQSFDPRALQAVHGADPKMATSLLMEGIDKRSLDDQLSELGFMPAVYSPHFSLVTDAIIHQCRLKGIRIVPWTVNTLDGINKLRAMGVDGVITDYPDLFGQL